MKNTVKIDLLNIKGENIGQAELNESVFNSDIKKTTVTDAVLQELASRRRGTADTKTRADVRGGGKKPWKQKGTGQARVGSIRNPVWKGGGVVWGPHPRSYAYRLPKKMRKVALRSALSDKNKNKKIIVIDEIVISEPKTKQAVTILKNLKIEGNALFVIDNYTDILKRSFRNLASVSLRRWDNLMVHEILDSNKIVITKQALEQLNNIFDNNEKKTASQTGAKKADK